MVGQKHGTTYVTKHPTTKYKSLKRNSSQTIDSICTLILESQTILDSAIRGYCTLNLVKGMSHPTCIQQWYPSTKIRKFEHIWITNI